jgi:O-antigen/teichoic acid export membrane protein
MDAVMNKTKSIMKRNIFRGALASMISLVVIAAMGLFITPIVVNHLGDRFYGVWVIIATITGYFAFLDLGLSKAVMRFVSQSLGMGDKNKADEWISIALLCFAILSLVSILLSVAVWTLAPLFLANTEDIEIISFALFIALLAFSIALPTRCFLGVLEAHVRRYLVSIIQVLISIFRSSTIFIVIFHKCSIVELVAVTATYTLIEGVLLYIFARRVHGPFCIKASAIKVSNVKIFFDYSFASFITQIMDTLRYRSYPMIITPFLGLAALTPFAIADRIVQLLVSICNGILLNLTPAFSQLEGKEGLEENQELRKAYLFSYKLSCYMGVFFIGMAFILGGTFIETWMGVKYLNAVPVFYTLLIGVLFSIIQIPTLCLLFAVSKHRFYAVTNTMHALLTIALCLMLVGHYNVLGVAIGISSATILVKFFLQPIAVLRFLKMGFFKYHINVTIPNVVMPLIFICLYFLSVKDLLRSNYLNMILAGGLGSLLFLIYICVVGFSRNEKRLLFQAIIPSRILI